MKPRVVQKINIPIDEMMIVQSITFCLVVSAHDNKWNNAGKVKAIGVHVSEPTIERNLSSLLPIAKVNPIVTPTKTVLLTFFNIYLFLVLGQPAYMIFSSTIWAGYKTKG